MAPKKKSAKRDTYSSIADIHRSFIENLESLGVFVSNLRPVAKKQDEVIVEQTKNGISRMIERFGKELGLPIESNDKEKFSQALEGLNKGQRAQMMEIVRESTRGLRRFSPRQSQLLHQASFILLMSYLDFLFSDLLHYFYHKYPQNLSEKESTLTLGELGDFSEIGDAVDFLIDKEVQRILFMAFDKQVQYFKNTLKVDIKEKHVVWKRLQEAMERRHLIVHNNSIVNKRYLRNVDLSFDSEKRKKIREGVRLEVGEDYFRVALEEVLVAGDVLIQCCWRKWEQDSIDEADSSLNVDIYNELTKESWPVAERLGLFSKECNVVSQKARFYLNVNYCQSLKWQGKNADLEKELQSFDLSTLSPMYCLAVAALKSDSTRFWQYVENAVIVDGMKEADFTEWPLFRELRTQRDYEAKIKEAFASIPMTDSEANQQ